MGNGKETPAVNLEQLIAQQSELQKAVGVKRKELKEVEKKNRAVKAPLLPIRGDLRVSQFPLSIPAAWK